MGVRNNANIWVISEWYLHVAGYVFLLIVGACIVVCMVLVCVLWSRPALKMYPIYSCVQVLGCAYAAFDHKD